MCSFRKCNFPIDFLFLHLVIYQSATGEMGWGYFEKLCNELLLKTVKIGKYFIFAQLLTILKHMKRTSLSLKFDLDVISALELGFLLALLITWVSLP